MDIAAPAKSVREKRSLLSSLVRVVLVMLVLGVVVYVIFFGSLVINLLLHQNPGPFDRKKMEAIVEEVRHTQMKPGETREFRLNDSFDPKSLTPSDPEHPLGGSDTGLVSARMSSTGKLTVVIETNDYGHAGSFGFAYSDEPFAPIPFPHYPGSKNLDVPSRLNEPVKKIDDHWWEVQYSLG